MKLTIIGAGAIGGTIGAHMIRAGHEIVLCDADHAHVDAINRSGLRIEGPVENFTVEAHAITPDQLPPQLDKVALATKSHHTATAAEVLRGRIAPGGYLVSFQNGLTADALADVVGWDNLLVSFVNFGADVMAPGVIMQGNIGTFRVGEPRQNVITDRVRELCDALPYAEPTDNVMGYLWGKEAYGAMLYAGAVSDLSIADHLESPKYRPLMLAIAKEVLDQAPVPVLGFDGFEPSDLEGSLDRLVAFNRASAKSHSGIYRDLMVRKRKTEVDDLLHDLKGPLTTHTGRLIQAIERGERTCEVANLDLLDTYRKAHEADPRLAAIVHLVDAPLRAPKGPLHGVSIAVKDSIAVEGLPRSNGNPNDAKAAPESGDASVVRRIRDAGGDVFATTTLLEYAAGAPHPDIPDARNPHDLAYTAGGSSGGSAAVVAAGIAPMAVGTDTGGSLRIPAHYCGVPAFLPTLGTVPSDGITPLSPSLDRAGLFAADLSLLRTGLRVITGLQFTQSPSQVPLKVGIMEGHLYHTDTRPDVREACERAIRSLDAGGVTTFEVDVTIFDQLGETFDPIVMYELYECFGARFEQDPAHFGAPTARLIESSKAVTRTQYEEALATRESLVSEALKVFSEPGIVLVEPVAPYVAPHENPPMDSHDGYLEGLFTRTHNLTGSPSASIPLPVPQGSLPVGLMVSGAPHSDEHLLDALVRIAELI
ncbi:MAG: amidase family protein [Acidimicrobiales bacterium]